MAKDYQNTMRYLRQRFGMCARCGESRGTDGTKWLCTICREWKRQHNYELRARRKQAGICRDCQKPRGDDGTKIYCRVCADKVNEAVKVSRTRSVAQGCCRQCRKPRRNRHSVCTPCLAQWAEKRRQSYHQQKLDKIISIDDFLCPK